MNENSQMQELCALMWDNYFSKRLADALADKVSFFKAKVVSVDSNTHTATVIRPFDSTTLTLPCAKSAANGLKADDMCVVFSFGDLSNSYIIASADLLTL